VTQDGGFKTVPFRKRTRQNTMSVPWKVPLQSWPRKLTVDLTRFGKLRFTHLKFNSSPLKSYRVPIGKDRLPTSNHHFSESMLNFRGVDCLNSILLLPLHRDRSRRTGCQEGAGHCRVYLGNPLSTSHFR